MIIDGEKVAADIQQEISHTIQFLTERKPCLAVILVGQHAPSQIYVNRKTQACEAVGIKSIRIQLPDSISEKDLISQIQQLNQDQTVDGILIQLPLPHHIHPQRVNFYIDPHKDVDGFHPLNMGKLLLGDSDGFVPCTPLGIKTLFERYQIEMTGRHAVVIGRSNIVGKPMAALLMQSTPGGNATVTIAHRHTVNLKELCRLADILIVAIGQPHFVQADMVKEGVVVIDVGINKIEDPSRKSGYRIVGDVDFAQVEPKCSYITPVPKGVGPMTIAMLLYNTLKSYQRRMSPCA